MRTPHRINGFGALALTLLASLAAACQPSDERPGFWLSGEVETGPIADWSFSDDVAEVWVETQTWYGIPHSVTIWGAAADGVFYLPSLYNADEEYPHARYWNRNIARDPHVRVKIGDRLFEGAAELVTDSTELKRATAAFASKYHPEWTQYEEAGAKWIVLRFEPGAAG